MSETIKINKLTLDSMGVHDTLDIDRISVGDMMDLREIHGKMEGLLADLKSGKKDIKSIKNLDYIVYTILHIETIKDICSKLGVTDFNKYHDLDKIAMYCFLPKKEASAFHRRIMKHHNHNCSDTVIEQLIDWESASKTKPDKPLSAYETLLAYYKDSKIFDKFVEGLKQLGLWEKGNYACITEEDFYRMANNVSDDTVIRYLELSYSYLSEIFNAN